MHFTGPVTQGFILIHTYITFQYITIPYIRLLAAIPSIVSTVFIARLPKHQGLPAPILINTNHFMAGQSQELWLQIIIMVNLPFNNSIQIVRQGKPRV